MDSIASYSKHLSGTLNSLVSAEDFETLEQAFIYAMRNGGGEEYGFLRQPGVSFNPRPARVALILIGDVGICDAEVLAAAIIATTGERLEGFADGEDSTRDSVKSLARLALLPVSELESLQTEHKHSGALIALALWLDRARHLHQATSPEVKEGFGSFVGETEAYIALASTVAKPLETLLQAWKARFERNFLT